MISHSAQMGTWYQIRESNGDCSGDIWGGPQWYPWYQHSPEVDEFIPDGLSNARVDPLNSDHILQQRRTQYGWTGQQIYILNMICFNSVLQLAIDQARGYYLNLLYRYLSLTHHQSSRINASLHSTLKTLKDFAEQIRSQLVDLS